MPERSPPRGYRNSVRGGVDYRHGGVLALEVLGRVPAGEHHAVFAEPGVVAGLALSLPVGWMLAKLARSIEQIVDAIVNSSRRRWSRHVVLATAAYDGTLRTVAGVVLAALATAALLWFRAVPTPCSP